MARFPISKSKSLLPLHLLIFHLLALHPISSISLETLVTNNINFDPQIALLGDARISGNSSSVQLTTPNALSSGLLLHKDPFRFRSSSTTSFSTEFVFSFTGHLIGLSLVMGPFNFVSNFLGQGQSDVLHKKGHLGIEFGYAMDGNGGDPDNILVLIRVSNEPLGHFVAKRGQKLRTWIDYNASSKRLEIRINKLFNRKPYDPFVDYPLDLFELLGDNDVYVALGSKNGANISEICNVYSWRFRLKKAPKWLHSLPVNPHASTMDNGKAANERLRAHRRKYCPWTIFAGLIFATGCGALLAFMVLFMWAIFVKRDTASPAKSKVQPVDFRYEKIAVVVEKDGEVAEN